MATMDSSNHSEEAASPQASEQLQGQETAVESEPTSRRRPNLCRFKKTIIGLSITLVVVVAVAIAFSFRNKSEVKVNRQSAPQVSAVRSGNGDVLPWSDEFSSSKKEDPDKLTQLQFTVGAKPTPNPTRRRSRRPTPRPTKMKQLSGTRPTKRPTQKPRNPQPTPRPTKKLSPAQSIQCGSNQYAMELVMQNDKFGKETWFDFKTVPQKASVKATVTFSAKEGEFGSFEKRVYEECVSKGDYNLTVYDKLGGMCCKYGQGYYTVRVDGELIAQGGNFNEKSVSRVIKVGYVPPMSATDREWVDAHNKRREQFHTDNNVPFSKVKWSTSLEKASGDWATEMLKDCTYQAETGVKEGENVAFKKGNIYLSATETPEAVVKRWYDNQINGSPPGKSATQVIWRSTQWIGCATQSKEISNGRYCYISICRYARAGNCQGGQFNTWKKAALAEVTPCGPVCPEEGCY